MRKEKFFASILAFLISASLCAMDVVVGDLQGQLGNQMFIIAATTSLALDNDAIAVFPDLKKNKKCGIPLNHVNFFSNLETDLNGVSGLKVYHEPYFHYKSIPFKRNMRLRGFFQSEKYFLHHKKEILEMFSPSDSISRYLREKYSHILDSNSTVSIHFRDYKRCGMPKDEKFEDKTNVHPLLTLQYYKNAIEMFPKDSLFVVFSDNIKWCKKQFHKLKRKFIFIEREDYVYDFYLMSMCKHNVIANSTFSWWAAYLNENPNKIVIAPKAWFHSSYDADTKDLLPESWIAL